MITPVKDIVTRYAARGSKAKKMKMDAQLIKDPLTRKITAEVATYTQKLDSREIDERGLTVTSIDLGTINRSTCNKFFKFSVDHMLTQSEKDNREKKELKAMVTSMVAYIDSLVNLGVAPIIKLPQLFDPNSAESQSLTRQVQRGKLLAKVVGSWVNNMIQEGNKFISEFTNVYAEGETLTGEIQTLVPMWETEVSHC